MKENVLYPVLQKLLQKRNDFSANLNQNGLQKLHGCFLVQLTRNMQGKKATMQYNMQHKVKVDDKKLW